MLMGPPVLADGRHYLKVLYEARASEAHGVWADRP
jgi:hypothetical protein